MGTQQPPHLYFTGAAGAGKDTAGDYLVARHGYTRLSFSDGIRVDLAKHYVNSPGNVTPAWLADRRVKQEAQPALALRYCSDSRFVTLALKAFEEEDRLFAHSPIYMAMCARQGVRPAEGGLTLVDRLSLPRTGQRIAQIWGTEHRRSQDPYYWIDYAARNADTSRPLVLTSCRNDDEYDYAKSIGAIRVHIERPGHVVAHDHATEHFPPPASDTVVVENLTGQTDIMLRRFDDLVHSLQHAQGACPTAMRLPA